MFTQSFKAFPWSELFYSFVIVLFRRYSFGLFIRSLFSSLPVPFLDNIRSLIDSLFFSLPIPFPNNICVSIRSLISSLPDPFPSNSVLLFVWFRPTPAPDYASSLTPWYHSLMIPGFDPRLSFGLDIGFPWTLLFAGSRL